ncbi:Uncharacterized conserved protein [Ceraceosorus bombacis]|uniref:Uncharacterized conserved protein n=1 Tax=Ceraceosorus bombacis TaxID=401625 RepID=A0A0P1BM52_9BASI|nr:Uncharacterized conserved protein [Ceraceosorus bombacis]
MSFLDDDWQEMPVVREAAPSSSISSSDEDDIGRREYGTPGGAGPSSLRKKKLGHARKKSAHMSSAGASKAMQGNATGVHLDIDDARGYSWREAPSNKKSAADLGNDEGGEPCKGGTGATPLSQLATTKKLLTEGQKIAYVGLVSLVARDMIRKLERVPGKEMQPAAASADEWRLRVMARLYQHMDIEADEQSMIESLAQHGVLASDMAPSLITTSKVDNPDFDPEAKAERDAEEEPLEGVTEELSSADEHITLDLRWTVLCDLFLVLTADSVYDARSRVLLETVAAYLSLTWMDVTKFEKRVTDALEIEEGVSGSLKSKKAIKKRAELARRRRLVMMGLATVGGGLIIGFSAGMLAPVIGAGLGAALGTIGVGGTTGFLGGVGGAAVITGTATAGGMAIGGRGMSRRTRTVRTFEFKPVHNNKRVNCLICVGGFMNGAQDDPRLPFSVIDSVMGDVFAVLWEPDMMKEMGDAIYLLYTETVVQGLQQVLAATIAGGLVGALAAPLWLTKLGLLIDNPWSNALDRSWSAGLILADVLAKRAMGVRPVTLVGFSLGARSIFYALTELAKNKRFGVVQDVFIIGAPVTASDAQWKEARSVVSGRFVNAFSRTDWILGYLFRATTGGIRSIAGLHPVERVPDVENVDVTTTVPGHLQYRAFMPLVLDELGFKTTADYFDEPEDLNNVPDREVLREALQIQQEEEQTKKVQNSSGGFGRIFKRNKAGQAGVGDASTDSSQSSTPAQRSSTGPTTTNEYEYDDDDLPPREPEREPAVATPSVEPIAETADAGNSALAVAPKHLAVDTVRRSSDLASTRSATPEAEKPPNLAVHFDTEAMLAELRSSGIEQLKTPMIATTRDDARRQAEPSNQAASQALAADLPRRPSATPTPYAHSFSESPFSRLPPPAPPAMMTEDSMGGVSLSFADSYSDEEDELAPPVPAPGQAAPVSLDAARGYGLSSDAARELARRFNEPDSRASHEESGRASSLEGRAASYLPTEDDGWGGDSSRQGRDEEGDVASNSRSDDIPRPSSSKDLPVAPDGSSPWSSPASHNPFAYNDEGRESSGDIAFSSSTPRGPNAIRQETLAEPPRSLSFDRLAIDDSSNSMPEGLQVRQPALRNTSSSAWETDNPWG